MNWGMNIEIDADIGAAVKFIDVVAKAGMRHVKLNIKNATVDLSPIFQALKANGMMAYLSPYRFEDRADQLVILNGDYSSLLGAYHKVCFDMPKEICLGVALPENAHLITRVGASAKVGIRRERVRAIFNGIAAVIRGEGHKVILPVRLDDIQGDVWRGVDFDVYDLETMLSPSVARSIKEANFEAALQSSKKPIWFGKAGVLGGYVMPMEQAKALRRLEGYAKCSEYTFLWSEKAVERFHWSVDGEFMVDVLQKTVKAMCLNQKPGATASAGLLNWKASKRAPAWSEASGTPEAQEFVPEVATVQDKKKKSKPVSPAKLKARP